MLFLTHLDQLLVRALLILRGFVGRSGWMWLNIHVSVRGLKRKADHLPLRGPVQLILLQNELGWLPVTYLCSSSNVFFWGDR